MAKPWRVHANDALLVLQTLDAASVDAIVTDPPAGIAFMGKDWDNYARSRGAFIGTMGEIFREARRVLKPGGHALVWALPRTSHWTAMALENAGYEIRDCVYHLFGTGFPKGVDISKAIDKEAGAEREVIGLHPQPHHNSAVYNMIVHGMPETAELTAPATDAARQWEGWNTALKPAAEPWWLARAPLQANTIAANVVQYGTGALNIGATRIGQHPYSQTQWTQKGMSHPSGATYGVYHGSDTLLPSGRWPANVTFAHDAACTNEACAPECAVAMLDAQSDDTGGASRFFFCAKASTEERNAGLPPGTRNDHPTVKNLELCRWLIRLITPPHGLILDPFAGSGSIGCAAMLEGMRYIGVDQVSKYAAIADKRIHYWYYRALERGVTYDD